MRAPHTTQHSSFSLLRASAPPRFLSETETRERRDGVCLGFVIHAG